MLQPITGFMIVNNDHTGADRIIEKQGKADQVMLGKKSTSNRVTVRFFGVPFFLHIFFFHNYMLLR